MNSYLYLNYISVSILKINHFSILFYKSKNDKKIAGKSTGQISVQKWGDWATEEKILVQLSRRYCFVYNFDNIFLI